MDQTQYIRTDRSTPIQLPQICQVLNANFYKMGHT